jgi:hydrogenase/urease accessory protein HupE
MKRLFCLLCALVLPTLAQAHPLDEIPAAAPRVWETVKTYITSGVHHIAIGPDHILFVIGLILLGGRVRDLLKIITAFTLAHSITLTLAAQGIFVPPGRIVEPLIALSIVCIGTDNLMALRESSEKKRDWRVIFAFGFGLIHGFGFASVLQEFGLPQKTLVPALISFNVGVEVGQAAIVCTVAPLLAWLGTKSERWRIHTTRYGSVAIALLGTFWFLQRLFGA